jgi:Cys-tRNA(Pro)/Cys-tRNA(Cys) deacylase
MAKQVKKLNSMRLLESHGVAYTVHEYPAEIHNAEEVAAALGLPPATVYKTLVALRANNRPVLVIVPGPGRLDLKALAAAVGEKKMSMATHADAEKLTGLKVGGISALALTHKGWDVVLDAGAEAHDTITISAGQRGLNLSVPVAGLKAILKPRVAPVIEAD